MELTIVISYYKALNNLKLILAGLQQQSDMRFEVIISEDDCNQSTIDFVKLHATDYQFSIIHLNQEGDLGFRKNEMLNKSIQNSNSESIVFIDGDCIPAKHFAKHYIQCIGDNHIYWGRRVMLGKKISSTILHNKSLRRLNFFNVLFSDSRKIKEAIYSPLHPLSFSTRGLKGCNWGVSKKYLVQVNGFDEDYIRAGVGEDNDIEWRLQEIGLTKVSMKNKAIVYHLFHERGYSNDGVKANFKMFEKKQAQGHIKCINGLRHLESTEKVIAPFKELDK